MVWMSEAMTLTTKPKEKIMSTSDKVAILSTLEAGAATNAARNIFDLRQMTAEEATRAEEGATGDYAILMSGGSFCYRSGSWDALTSVVTNDMVAVAYLGDGSDETAE